jgi:hypothetical protein
MDDSELGQLLARAADEFPVLHRPLALERRVTRRRRITTAFALAAGAAALTGAAILIPFMMTSDGTTKPASTASGGYVGSRWQLTSVADGTTSTPIPGDAGANIEFWTDGRIVVRTGTDTLTGRFSPVPGGFEVRDVGTTLAVYGGKDPHRLAAIAALNTMAYGNRAGVTPSNPVQDAVVTVTGTDLVIRAGGLRLTFDRVGPSTPR